MFKLTKQEMSHYIDIKWEAESNLKRIPKLIEYLDWVIPNLPEETERRFVQWVQSGMNSKA